MTRPDSVLLVVIDGMRPDGLERADARCMKGLIARGAWAPRARTVLPSSTLPCHTSLLLGVMPDRHGITTNAWRPLVRPVPSLVDTVHAARRSTAAFYNWEELRDLSQPGSLDRSCFIKNCYEPDGDAELAAHAAEFMAGSVPAFTFLYFGHVDVKGHDSGWMSGPYLDAIRKADQAIAKVLGAIEAAGRLESTAVIVTSDHGGHAQTHGTDMDEDMTIPVVLAGPGVRPAVVLDSDISICDIAPTVLALLDIPAPAEWSGTPIRAALTEA